MIEIRVICNAPLSPVFPCFLLHYVLFYDTYSFCFSSYGSRNKSGPREEFGRRKGLYTLLEKKKKKLEARKVVVIIVTQQQQQ